MNFGFFLNSTMVPALLHMLHDGVEQESLLAL